MKLGLVFGSVVFLIAVFLLASNLSEVMGLSDLEITNIAANATANATAAAMDEANKLLEAAKNVSAKATQTGIERAKSVLANVTNNVSNATPNTTGTAIDKANDVLSSAPNATGNTTAETQTYENRDVGIKFQYPSDWGEILDKSEPGCQKQQSCVLAMDREGTNTNYSLRFLILKLPKENCNCNSLKDFVTNLYNQHSASSPGFSFINDNQTEIGKNYSGWQYEYSFSPPGEHLRGINVFATNNDAYYSIALTYPNESRYLVLPAFKNVIDSIEFLPIQNPSSKTPSFMTTNETEESKNSTTIGNNTIFEENLPPITVGDRVASLHTKISPPDKKQDALFQLRLVDNKTGNNITNVNYYLTISKGGKELLRELFYSKEGPLTLKFQPNQGPITVYGGTEPFLGGWTDESGQITVSGPVLTEGGQYNYAVEIFGIDNVRNIFKPENAPRFDSSFSLKMNETEQTKPSLPLESNPNGLQILSHNSFIDSIGYFHVVGEVMNNTPTVAQFVQVTGTFYDSNNQVVGTQFAYTNPSDIGSGQKAPFEITLLSASIPVSQVDHYNLVASSQ